MCSPSTHINGASRAGSGPSDTFTHICIGCPEDSSTSHASRQHSTHNPLLPSHLLFCRTGSPPDSQPGKVARQGSHRPPPFPDLTIPLFRDWFLGDDLHPCLESFCPSVTWRGAWLAGFARDWVQERVGGQLSASETVCGSVQ